jgi:hypothetical protein
MAWTVKYSAPGLDAAVVCPQMAWAKYRRTVAELLSPPDELVFFCGMSIGFEDLTVGDARAGRCAARRDGHVSRWLLVSFSEVVCTECQKSSAQQK